ncbi:hypothetical protein ZOD2009_01075 [Haladaptatus paucihalophilus DX253]|uniref:Uncharacterized Zn-finger containing protein, UPF0148 family n=1 Tax=Haladaptatus paucihalophilus DX253 TaxID=797209 RepID=E7QP39_HALPU|nr:Sjogren's syndrome/scleroderma autoantigen 1 family protein [Haladaptatus paucihalophilus]EFW93692.1 hypothetical protein ZOD2009_01075 [Haladaptatus paucihalophilus DX253]SHL48073.1 Uncharacterized Zn-finger containing protein, UPF0148 family [Haladaptatus paucihalophilus DX253]
MSDFDKEAEREKLRQQYENEKEERKSTQRMSELLLQGATMTGKHCDTCGDPIFRMNGTEFCPTCQGAGNEASKAETTEAETPETVESDASAETETAGEPSEISVESPGHGEEDAQTESTGMGQSREPNRAQSPTPPQSVPRQSRRVPPSQTGGENRSERARQPETRAAGTRTAAESGTDDLSAAREALVRKLTALAREAEGTNDVGYSRELLAATREAAEALAALDRANR